MTIYDDQVIEAAYLHSKPGCFFIGPYARRVSFASQQYRALDLVTAMKEKRYLVSSEGKPKLIAVIGAGVAGLTASFALRGEGVRVHLYESALEPLTLQQDSTHRLIHPTISRWPTEDLSLTTNLSFLDWFCAPGSQVVSSLRSDWQYLKSDGHNDPNFEFLNGVTVTEFVCERGKVALRIRATPNQLPPNRVRTIYDHVIVTTGFGAERAPKGLTAVSYWRQDDIDEWRKTHKRVFVSGCGDGGLIDCLRLIHAHFDGGWLAIRLAHDLDKMYADDIKRAEDEALMAAKSLTCMGLDSADPRAGRTLGSIYDDQQIVGPLTDFYIKLVDRLPASARTMLDDSITEAGAEAGQVVLVSMQTHPFGPYAAPIHKIMVAHAMSVKAIEYRERGQLSVKDRRPSFDYPPPSWREPERVGDHGLVIRHGSPANLDGLIGKKEQDSLRIRQFMLADYIDTRGARRLRPPENYPTIDYDRAKYVGSRAAMASELISLLRPGATLTALEDRFVYEASTATNGRSIPIPVPEKIFGIEISQAPRTSTPIL